MIKLCLIALIVIYLSVSSSIKKLKFCNFSISLILKYTNVAYRNQIILKKNLTGLFIQPGEDFFSKRESLLVSQSEAGLGQLGRYVMFDTQKKKKKKWLIFFPPMLT